MFTMLSLTKVFLFLHSFVAFRMYSLKEVILLYSLKIIIVNYSLLAKNTQRLQTNDMRRNTQENKTILSVQENELFISQLFEHCRNDYFRIVSLFALKSALVG